MEHPISLQKNKMRKSDSVMFGPYFIIAIPVPYDVILVPMIIL